MTTLLLQAALVAIVILLAAGIGLAVFAAIWLSGTISQEERNDRR